MGKTKELFNENRENEFLNDLHEPKSKLKEFDLFNEIERMIERVNEGYENELEIYVMFSRAKKAFESAMKDILGNALLEFDKHEEKTVNMFGAKISKSVSGVKYDYSGNKDWVDLSNKIKNIQELMKDSYNAFVKGNQYVTEDGEIIPPATRSSGTISLKIG